MSTTPARKKLPLQILAGLLIAIVPPTLSYCQATAEMRERNKKTNEQANAGYETLVDSVKELQETVKKQHETILTMRGSIAALMQIVARTDVGMRMTTPTPAPAEPAFAPIPQDLAAAQQQMAK